MKAITSGFVSFAFAMTAFAFTRADEPKKEHDKLQGEWSVVSWEGKTFSLTAEKVKKSNLVIEGDVWQPTIDDKKAIKFEAKLDPSKSPKEIDITLLEKFGGKDGFRMTGIYKLDGDTLTVCRTISPDYDRPKEFKVAEGYVLIVFKRAEKKK